MGYTLSMSHPLFLFIDGKIVLLRIFHSDVYAIAVRALLLSVVVFRGGL